MLEGLKKTRSKNLLSHSVIRLSQQLEIEKATGIFRSERGDFTDLIANGRKTAFKKTLAKLSGRGTDASLDLKMLVGKEAPTTYRLIISEISSGYLIVAVEIGSMLELQQEAEKLQM